jgi:hypothetical protein
LHFAFAEAAATAQLEAEEEAAAGEEILDTSPKASEVEDATKASETVEAKQ